MYTKDETIDKVRKMRIKYINLLISNNMDEEYNEFVDTIIDEIEKQCLDVFKTSPKILRLLEKVIALLREKVEYSVNFILGQEKDVFLYSNVLDDFYDNYNRLLKGVERTRQDKSYNNICILVEQKAEVSYFLSALAMIIKESSNVFSFDNINYNYYIALKESRAKVLELDSMYSEEKTKNMHN